MDQREEQAIEDAEVERLKKQVELPPIHYIGGIGALVLLSVSAELPESKGVVHGVGFRRQWHRQELGTTVEAGPEDQQYRNGDCFIWCVDPASADELMIMFAEIAGKYGERPSEGVMNRLIDARYPDGPPKLSQPETISASDSCGRVPG